MMKSVSSRLEVRCYIGVSCKKVWDIITDTTLWVEWGPSITAVECNDRYIRMGSRGRVKTAIGLWVPYEITAYDEGKYWSWSVFGISATGHRVKPYGDNSCQLIFEIPFLAAPYAYICRIALKRISLIVEKRDIL